MDSTAGFSVFSDEHYMRQALRQAELAFEEDEVPIGAIVVAHNRVIGKGYNQVEKLNDATAHAEMIAATAASQYLGHKYLDGCTLYVTIEPCAMCAGALRWLQFDRVVYGASEPKVGYTRYSEDIIHPKTEVLGGLMAEECAQIMKNFFKKKRDKDL